MSVPTPSEAARAHCLQELAMFADSLAAARERACSAVSSADDLDYLRAFARTARSIADRLRASPGFRMDPTTGATRP